MFSVFCLHDISILGQLFKVDCDAVTIEFTGRELHFINTFPNRSQMEKPYRNIVPYILK